MNLSAAVYSDDGPPYSNRGVYPSIPVEDCPHAISGVDAYCGTVFANADSVYSDLQCLLEGAGFEPKQVTGEKVPYYARNLLLIAPDGHRLLQVRAGGANPFPFVECEGIASPVVCGFIRASYDHRPTRMDVAVDKGGDGLFDELDALSRRIARKHGVAWEPVGKGWAEHTPEFGRTIYLGSRKSQVFVRIYEKGLKYALELGIPMTDALRNWVRIEVEFKPQNRKSKALASKLTPDAIWGISDWLSEFSLEAFAIQAERVNINQRRESNRERALRFMGSQYGAHLRDLFTEMDGDPAAFGVVIADLAGVEHEHH